MSLWLWVGAEKSAGERHVQYNDENPEDCAPGKIEPITTGQRCQTVLGMAARLCARHSGPCYWSSAAAPNRTVAVITPTPTDKPTTVETSLINSPRRSVLMSSSSSTSALCPLPSALSPTTLHSTRRARLWQKVMPLIPPFSRKAFVQSVSKSIQDSWNRAR